MSQLEKLNTRYNQVRRLLDAINQATRKVDADVREKQQKVLEKYFTAQEGDTVECSYSSVSVRRAGTERYNSFIDLYLEDQWEEDTRVYTHFYISNSSFRSEEMAEWIVDRFTSQAYYATIALDFQDDIIAEINQIIEESKSLIEEITKPAKELRKESKELSEKIESIKKAARQQALMSDEGLVIEGVERERWGSTYTEFPDLQVKWDWTLRSIRGLRIDRMSTSGKSADITVKVKRESWDPSSGEWTEKIVDEKVERVRMENIEFFLRRNNIAV